MPRLRCAVAICYAVVADGEKELKEGTEEMKAVKCSGDNRAKPGLIAVKRLELARRWLIAILGLEEVWRVRRIPFVPKPPQWALTTDASPFRLGRCYQRWTSRRARSPR